ncbi:MAG: carboxypeptidase-like regulatory domain-containing protein [Planctomycetaceae bacterium]
MKTPFLGLVLSILVVGCGGGPPDEKLPAVFPVEGTVTLDGTAVAGATVTFIHPETEKNAIGRTNEKGEFKLTTFKPDDGALAGRHNIVVTQYDEPVADANGVVPAAKNGLPKRYETIDGSQLHEEVTAAGPNKFEIKLTK